MDVLDELVQMARLILDEPDTQDEPTPEKIRRLQNIFGCSHAEAASKIREHRANLARVVVSDDHWEMVRLEKEAEGYDKEVYEYSFGLAPINEPVHIKSARKKAKEATYLLKLEGPLSHPIMVRAAADLPVTPPRLLGNDEDNNEAVVCKVGEVAKQKILAHLSKSQSLCEPKFVRYFHAEKDLSATSGHPTLNIDATLPQHRPTSATDPRLLPAQNEYPVWYFFYGTLADASVLSHLLGVCPVYRKARIRGGVLGTWGGRYKALLDDPAGGVVEGRAFCVTDQDNELYLQAYEGDNYEVVRCLIEMDDGNAVRGLTFRFVGEIDF